MKHSEWKVTSQYFGDKKKYAVYRLKDAGKTDHSGNREYASGYMDNLADAESMAERLNMEGVDKNAL